MPEEDIARSPVGIMSGAKEMNYSQRMKERTEGRGEVNEQKRLPWGIGRERKSVVAFGIDRSSQVHDVQQEIRGNFGRKYVPRAHQIMILWILISLSRITGSMDDTEFVLELRYRKMGFVPRYRGHTRVSLLCTMTFPPAVMENSN